MIEKLINAILLRSARARRACQKFVESIDGQLTEKFLQLLLKAMKLVFLISPEFRKNIENFNGRYCFKSEKGGIETSVVFRNGKMEVLDKAIDDAHMTVRFKDPAALRNYILSPKPDILGSLLKQEFVPEGNFKYLYKFAFMAKRLQLMNGGLPPLPASSLQSARKKLLRLIPGSTRIFDLCGWFDRYPI